MMPFGIRRAERLYVPRTPRVSPAEERLLAALDDSVDRRHHASRKRSSTLIGQAERSFKAARLFDWGRDGYNTKSLGWTTDVQKAMLLDPTVAGTWLKLITGAGVTFASPAVYGSTGHGFSNNDVVVACAIGGNLSTNQTGLATSVAANTLQLTTLEGQVVSGSAAWTSGGFLLNLTQAKFVADILGTRVSVDQTFAGTTSSKGVSNASSPVTWTAVTGNPVYLVFYNAAGGSDATNRLVGWQDGKIRVITVGDTPSTSTVMKIQPLRAELWDGSTGAAPVLWFSNGKSVTLSGAALMGADSLAVTSTASDIPDLQTADVTSFGAGIPINPSGAP